MTTFLHAYNSFTLPKIQKIKQTFNLHDHHQTTGKKSNKQKMRKRFMFLQYFDCISNNLAHRTSKNQKENQKKKKNTTDRYWSIRLAWSSIEKLSTNNNNLNGSQILQVFFSVIDLTSLLCMGMW